MSMRLALGLQYDGVRYAGWQRQRHASSVQQCLETALSRVADEPVTVTAAGRTDAGVHATHQVVHFDTLAERPDKAWVRGVTTHLPEDIGVLWVRRVPAAFHARYQARSRIYRYVIFADPRRPVLNRKRVAWTWKPLDPAPMRAGAAHLIGEHDFSAFRAAGCQARHARRCVERLELGVRGPFIHLDIEANAFLHHMVRNIAGVLMAIGAGERPPEWAADVLASQDRRCGGVTAPGDGLYLVGVRYPSTLELPVYGWLPAFA